MYPFSYTGLRLIHDQQVCEAMARACIDTELARNSRPIAQRQLRSGVLKSIRSRLRALAKPRSRIITPRPR